MVLIDTHVVLWILGETRRLSRNAVDVIRDARADDGLAVSAVTLYEVAFVVTRGRVDFDMPLQTLLRRISERFILKQITAEVAVAAASFVDPYPRDPMDRLIGATAVVEGIPLVTANERIRASGQVATIW